MEDKYKLEFDVSIDTFRVLCDMAKCMGIKRIYTEDGVINTEGYSITNKNGTIIDSTWSKDLINKYSQVVYQRIPEEKIFFELRIDHWTTRDALQIFTVMYDTVAFLYTGMFGMIPDKLTIFKNINNLMDGDKLGSVDFSDDWCRVGMKGVYIMLRGVSLWDFSDSETTFQQFMYDIQSIANTHNPTV